MSMFLVLQESCFFGAVSQVPEKQRQQTKVLFQMHDRHGSRADKNGFIRAFRPANDRAPGS